MGSEKPTVPEVLPRIHAYRDRPGNEDGGWLHIALADGNVADWCIEACLETCLIHGDEEGAELARVLLRMSKTQRTKIFRRFYEA